MGKSNAEHQAAHRQRQKEAMGRLRARIAELEAEVSRLQAMGSREESYVRTEARQGESYVSAMEGHGPEEMIEPMGYVMPWEAQ